ncbi:MAG: hypothetical protein M3Q42_10520 [Pseudomonadota bacterium]|nr:hypothetical protein [Pseudomonadota bacterium]
MKPIVITTTIAACLLLAACGNDTAPTETTMQAAADPAAQTEAVYGDEAPVAIEAEATAADDHAHTADGSHLPGQEHPAEPEAHPHDEDADHSH